jgi:N-acetylmuramoyl-L-alanine amidase
MAKRFTHSLLPINIIFILLLCFTGCGSHTKPPATQPAHVPGYLGLQEEFGNLDFSALRNRSIVIDPGHGGFFQGALGPEGLTEAEVNLGVALYLRGLLEWAGAQVHLTRTADYDFLTLADSTLAFDLAFRSSFTDSLQPDVFISIHHNSTASQDPDINETQTYYPLGDDGASLDLARSIHRHLVLNLEITPAKILPGNFHVLRNATVPAVLGEPAMISNPVMEGRLSLASSHELEAQAYFLGLLDYFSAGQPRWSAMDTLRMDAGMPAIALSKTFLTAAVGQPEGPGPDPSSFHLTLNGVTQGFDLSADGRSVTWRAAHPLPDGSAVLRLSGRNMMGRATPVSETVILVGASSRLKVIHSTESPEGNPNPRTMLFWHTKANATAEEGFLSVNGQFNLLLPPRSRGWFLLPEDAGEEPLFELRSRKTDHVSMVASSKGPHLPPGFRWRLLTIGEEPVFASSIKPPQGWHHRLQAPTIGYGNPMVAAGSPALVWNPEAAVWIEAKGVLPVVLPGSGREDLVGTISPELEIWRPRLLLHQLFGKTIILDPAGGGTNTGGTYTLGTRASDLNLETARQIKLLLEGAGARVFMTREGEVAPDPQQKILLAGAQKADLFLSIARALPGSRRAALHHPGSVVGERWAKAMIRAMAPMDSLTLGTSYAYLLRHTACPALEIQLSAPLGAEEEMRMGTLPWQMAEARAILLACAAALSPQEQWPQTVNPVALLDQLATHAAERSVPDVQWARWDGNFNWVRPSFQESTGTVASWDTTGWPAISDLHTLEIHSGSQWQMWRVLLTPDAPLFELMLENR